MIGLGDKTYQLVTLVTILRKFSFSKIVNLWRLKNKFVFCMNQIVVDILNNTMLLRFERLQWSNNVFSQYLLCRIVPQTQ